LVRDPLITNYDEAARVVRVVRDEPFAKIEDVDRFSWLTTRSSPGRSWLILRVAFGLTVSEVGVALAHIGSSSAR
jgi:hypothetical protein